MFRLQRCIQKSIGLKTTLKKICQAHAGKTRTSRNRTVKIERYSYGRVRTTPRLILFRIIRGLVSLSNSEMIKFSQLRPYRIKLIRVNTTRCKNYFLHRTFEQNCKLIASINLIPHIHGSALNTHQGCVPRYLINQSINQSINQY